MSNRNRVLIVLMLALFPLIWVGADLLLEQYQSLRKAGSGKPSEVAQWFKGNTHTHTLWSDGNDFPESVVRYYRQNGYQFLVLSDHNVLSRGERWMKVTDINARRKSLGHPTLDKYRALFGHEWVEIRRNEEGEEEVRLKALEEFRGRFEKAGEFLMIEGEEITDRFKGERNHEVHMNAANLGELVKPQGGASVEEVIANNLRVVREQEERLRRPILLHLNHPNFQWSIKPNEIANVIDLRFFEVYNGHPSINHLGRPAGDGKEAVPGDEQIWDIVNTIRIRDLKVKPLLGVATDDSHHYHGGDSSSGRGWVMVRAKRLAAEDLIASMRDGNFYASSGVELKLIHTDGTSLRVDIDEEKGAEYVTEIFGTRTGGDPAVTGELLASYEGIDIRYSFGGDELFVRARVTSSSDHPNPSYPGQKKQAWTQPVGWEKHLPTLEPPGDATTPKE